MGSIDAYVEKECGRMKRGQAFKKLGERGRKSVVSFVATGENV